MDLRQPSVLTAWQHHWLFILYNKNLEKRILQKSRDPTI